MSTRILLSFAGAYGEIARKLANHLKAANLEVRYDPWQGGGGAPAIRAIEAGVDEVELVIPLLTPSDAARTWIGDEWRRTVYDRARARGIDVLPVRGAGDLGVIPEFLRELSYADLHERDYARELRRLVETIRNRSGDAGIELPDDGREAARPPITIPADPLCLEVAAELAPLFEDAFLDKKVPMMRDGLFYELGVPLPGLHLRLGSELPPSTARIVINDIPETLVEVRPDSVMVNERVGALAELGFAAEPAVNPASGAECAWIPAQEAAAAGDRGLTTWDVPEYLVLSISAVLRRKAAHFIDVDLARRMLQQIEPVFPQLVAETVPKTVAPFVLADVLRRLVVEEVSIRDLRRILMSLADWGRVERDPLMLTEYARAALKRPITHRLSRGTYQLVVLLLHPDVETSIRDSIRHTATGTYVDLEPDQLRKILDAIREPMDQLPENVQVPQILTTMEIRSSVRRLVAPSLPHLHVVSYQELSPDVNIQPIGRISLDGFSPRDGVSVGGVPLWG